MRRGLIIILLLLGLTAGVAGALPQSAHPARGGLCVVPGAREPIDTIWHPDVGAAIAYARSRVGDITFAVRTAHRFYGYRADHIEWSASVVKAMLMVAYLNRPSVANRPLNGYDLSLLVPMITHSDNGAAQAVDDIVGNGGLSALAHRVGMTNFTPVKDPWGETRITARDQTRFLLHIDQYVVAAHRAYAMHLLRSITPSQRWGIGQVAPKGWHLYFKGGWGYGTGLLDHQVVLLTRGCVRVSLAVLSMYDGSHAYGKATLRGMFSRLLRGFPTGARLYPVVTRARYSGQLVGRGGKHLGTISFLSAADGDSIHDLVVVFNHEAPCGGGSLADTDPIGVDPRGNFALAHAAMVARPFFSLAGRFVPNRAARGTFSVGNRSTPQCDRSVSWVARAG